jgi:hypothetical protein
MDPLTTAVSFLAIFAIALLAWGAHRNVPKSYLEGIVMGAEGEEAVEPADNPDDTH